MIIMISISSICTIITLLSASWVTVANGIKPSEKIANLMKIYSNFDAEQKAVVDGLRTVKFERNQNLNELTPIAKGLFIEECINRFQMMVSSSAKSGEENQIDEQNDANKNHQVSANNLGGCESLWKVLGENEDHNRELRLTIQDLEKKLQTAQKNSESNIEQKVQQDIQDIEKRSLAEENSNLKRHVEQLKQEAIQNRASIMSQLNGMKTTQQALLVEFDRMISEKNQLMQDLEMCRVEKGAAEAERDIESRKKMLDKGTEDKIEATQREIDKEWIKVTNDDTNDTNNQLEMWIELATGTFARLIEEAHLNSDIKYEELKMKLKEYKQRAKQVRQARKSVMKAQKLEEKLMKKSANL